MRHFRQLTFTDRLNIEKWLKEGMKKGDIANKLRVCPNTITNELKRGRYTHLNSDYTTEVRYSPDIAEQRYQDNLRAKGPGYKIGNDIQLAEFLEKKMLGVQDDGTIDPRARYSPAAALAAAREAGFTTTLCKGTIYNYIKKGDVFYSLTQKDLIVAGKRKVRHHQVRAKRAPAGESIERRAEEINRRVHVGDWEMDSVIGGKGSKKCLVVLTERRTRYELAFIVPDHTAGSVVKVLNRIERRLGRTRFRLMFRSITVDNGCEFQDCDALEQSCLCKSRRTKIYYCHPYSSWERGSNENQNRMLRRFFPKGFCFERTTQAEVDRVVQWVNDYPRKLFGWRSSSQLFAEQFSAA